MLVVLTVMCGGGGGGFGQRQPKPLQCFLENTFTKQRNKTVKLAKAKEYYGLGLLESFAAVRVDDEESGWILSIGGKEGRAWTMHTAINEEKVYSSLESLNADVQRVLGDEAKPPTWSFKL